MPFKLGKALRSLSTNSRALRLDGSQDDGSVRSPPRPQPSRATSQQRLDPRELHANGKFWMGMAMHDSDDSETDEYGFAHKRKTSTPNAGRHNRRGSQEPKKWSCSCSVCGETCVFDEGEGLQRCPVCDVKILRKIEDNRPLPPLPVQQPPPVEKLEEMLQGLYEKYNGILLKDHEKFLQGSRGTRLAPPQHLKQNDASVATRVFGPLPADNNTQAPVSVQLQVPNLDPRDSVSTIRDGNSTPRKPTRKAPRPPNIKISGRPLTSSGVPPRSSLPSPHAPRTPLNAPRFRRNGDNESQEAGFSNDQLQRFEEARTLVKPVKDTLRSIFGNVDCLNKAFCSTRRPVINTRSKSESAVLPLGRGTLKYSEAREAFGKMPSVQAHPTQQQLFRDHKALMVGEVHDVVRPLADPYAAEGDRSRPARIERERHSTTPYVDWELLRTWYWILAGYTLDTDWCVKSFMHIDPRNPFLADMAWDEVRWLGTHILKSFIDLIDQVLTAPRPTPTTPRDLRYLIVLLENPVFWPKENSLAEGERLRMDPVRSKTDRACYLEKDSLNAADLFKEKTWQTYAENAKHRLLSVILGRLAHAPKEHHRTLIYWFASYPEKEFKNLVATVGDLIAKEIKGIKRRPREERKTLSASQRAILYSGVPDSALLEDVVSSTTPKYSKDKQFWRLRAACRIMQLLVAANDIHVEKPSWIEQVGNEEVRHPTVRRQLLPIDEFSFSLLDPEARRFDVGEDFTTWESRSADFTFCQYPFMLTLGTKVKILAYDCNRKKVEAARKEFHDSGGLVMDDYFRVTVQRDCLASDSLRQLKEAMGSMSGETLKKLRIKFQGEDGIDGGGVQKDWFLSLTQELFHGDHALFFFNPDSHYCYFNAFYYDSAEIYQLVGAIFGLAIYNQTPLYAPFPPFLFKKLAAAAPKYGHNFTSDPSTWRTTWRPSLKDFAELDPKQASYLQNLLTSPEFADDLDWSFPIPRYDTHDWVEICKDGFSKTVTKENREEYVNAVVSFYIDSSVEKHFGAFCRGFYQLCGGNALSLFRGEELELLLRGSNDLDLETLRAAAVYDNWKDSDGKELDCEEEAKQKYPVIGYFWDLFTSAELEDQKKILRFITGTDRLPPAGIVNLVLKISRIQTTCKHLPQARTCFNQLLLSDFPTEREDFKANFLFAVRFGSNSFGLK